MTSRPDVEAALAAARQEWKRLDRAEDLSYRERWGLDASQWPVEPLGAHRRLRDQVAALGRIVDALEAALEDVAATATNNR